ncbi:TIGR03986 family CRISPR-associated RAMP protein (plasmid) [Tistrella bauzanensis]|uniref:TIGR03986 family type III CRISPR-associated RAMP protein n=1 Tax=Tistrella TaxID=171436 RepID=UPI0031F6D468
MTDPRIQRIEDEAKAEARDIYRNNGNISSDDLDGILERTGDKIRKIGIDDDIIFKKLDEMESYLPNLTKRDVRRDVKIPQVKQGTGALKGKKEKEARDITGDEALLARSPFRFVALNERVATPEISDLTLDLPVEGGFSGCLRVTWAVETPLLIGDEVTEQVVGKPGETVEVAVPLRLGSNGPAVIPGASLRGMIRAATEIVAHSRLAQIDGHLRFGLRDFTHPRTKPENEADAPLAAKNIKAGWLRRNDAGGSVTYTITPCDWGAVMVHDLPVSLTSEADRHERWAEWLSMSVADRYQALKLPNDPSGMVSGQRNGKVIDFSKAPEWSFKCVDQDRAPKLYERVLNETGRSGHFIFSNKSPAKIDVQKLRDIDNERQKKKRGRPGQPKEREYVFFGEKALEKFDVRQEDWAQFERINTKPAKNKRVPDGSWASLAPSLNNGGRVPVFYVERQGGIELGLTRFFKIAHDHDVGTIRDRTSSHERPRLDEEERLQLDLVESLFGYVYEPKDILSSANGRTRPEHIARRGRVSFGMAYLQPGMPAEIWPSLKSDPIETVQGAPRASFAPFYLSGTIKDYSSPLSKLAGRKRYIPQTPADQKAKSKSALEKRLRHEKKKQKNISKEVISHLRFLVPKTDGEDLIFTSDIRLHNVTAVEVGALLWVLTHGGDPEKPYRHMIGRAKPFGAGQLRVKALALTLKGHDAGADEMLMPPASWELSSGSREGWTGEGGQSMAPFLRAFDAHMTTFLGEALGANTVIKEFLAASDPEIGVALAGAGRMNYPDLKDFNALRKASKLSTGKDGGPTWPERFLGMDLAVDEMVMDKATPKPRPIRLPYKETTKP